LIQAALNLDSMLLVSPALTRWFFYQC